MNDVSMTGSAAWCALEKHRDALQGATLGEMIAGDDTRLDRFEVALQGLRFNYALNFVVPETLSLLMGLARERDVDGWRTRMWAGEAINSSEKRSALHIALRQAGDAPLVVAGRNVMPEVREARHRLAAFVASVREGHYRGVTGKPIRHVVNIGIGGSDLGPRLVAGALASYAGQPQVHFVANVDAYEILNLCQRLDPAETLFVVVSKTFSTQETLLNAHTARRWIVEELGGKAVERHFVAVSTKTDKVQAFGIPPENTFPLWDWVGGRFSLWSAVGLSVELAIGTAAFENLLQGAAAMDAHFKTAPFEDNMPVMMAMLGIWSHNFLGFAAHAVLPYSERLHDLPRYLQQLEMESNGKSIGRDGHPVAIKTAPLIFGESGTVGQHGFHQWLHQGTDRVAADFIGVAEDDLGHPDHHQALLSNMAAQASALAFGQAQAAMPQDVYAGNRPSSLLILDKLDPTHLGMLLALYEHKIFVQSIIWGINPFDQPGVELGKRMAQSLTDGAGTANHAGACAARLFQKFMRV